LTDLALGYPQEAVEKLLKHLGVAELKNARIIDLASGTGKFTELLVARPEKFEVVAVEPHEGMRSTLEKKGLLIEVLDGNAESIPVKEGWADALIAAQVSIYFAVIRLEMSLLSRKAFHWFSTEEALKEINRVLIPGGRLGLIWNIEDCKLRDIVTPFEPPRPFPS